MKLEKKNLIVKRSHKEVYRTEDGIVKVFDSSYAKSDVLNEALIQARVEESGLNIAKLKAVTEIDEKLALVIEEKKGTTLEELAGTDLNKMDKYMDQFVELQLSIHEKKAPALTKLKDKLTRQINACKDLDATQRYELLTRLESMPW